MGSHEIGTLAPWPQPSRRGSMPKWRRRAAISHRHFTKGQAAMAVAKARLVSKQSVRDAAASIGLKSNRVAYAAVVLDRTPGLAEHRVGQMLKEMRLTHIVAAPL
jgi:hypothetical protein